MDTDLADLSLFESCDIHILSPYRGVYRPGFPAYTGLLKKAIHLHKNQSSKRKTAVTAISRSLFCSLS